MGYRNGQCWDSKTSPNGTLGPMQVDDALTAHCCSPEQGQISGVTYRQETQTVSTRMLHSACRITSLGLFAEVPALQAPVPFPMP